MTDLSAAEWVTSSYSGSNGGQCLEVARVGDHIAARDTKQHGAGPILVVPAAAWTAFLDVVHRAPVAQASA
ncbi:DUF397 domain-containing protein [Streptomyces carpaticus]|uniref:DUF397 domain-containing protein n=1 Tax=Streptomyces TaxID=1883 RepID=UPI00220DDE28|nr:DUF397 domain-containing protein [Streptomyces carpaticus]